MAVRDYEAFLREKAVVFDPNLDVNPGAPFDVQVIQPMVRRLGTDPFTVDLTTFINDRMTQAYPELASKDGDTITDLLNKPASLLWDPVVREVIRTQRNQSFADPSTLTEDESDALGANFFSTRRRGFLSRGMGRLFFSSAQNVSVSPVNFFTSKGGLHFFPIETQSIRTEEMLLNVTEGGLYYFDINVIAERSGVQYNIGPNSLISVANVPSAVKVNNPRKFRSGETEETAVEFIERIRQELSERSMVTLRGIAAKLVDAFPEINRINVVGFNDPEMERDVIQGGGLGEILASGIAGVTISDGEGAATTRYFSSTEVNFIALFGAIGYTTQQWVLTVFDALGGTTVVDDLNVLGAVTDNTIALEDQVLLLGVTGIRWTLRRRELTLSSIPGGILFPEGLGETVVIPDDTVHIGGAYDIHTRGTSVEESTTVFESVTDDQPILSGTQLTIQTAIDEFRLLDLVLDTDYVFEDATYNALEDAARYNYSLQIQNGPNASTYRILSVIHISGLPARLTVTPDATVLDASSRRWRLFDELNVDLLEPKETRISSDDLTTVQASDIVSTESGTDFDEYGVAEGDTLRLDTGDDAGDFTIVAAPLAPTASRLQLDRPLTRTTSGLSYSVFRDGVGEIVPPFVRVKTVELLDSSAQPLGSSIPYAKPVDVQSRAFQNPARGVDHEFRDASVGLVSTAIVSVVITGANNTLSFIIDGVKRDIALSTGTYDLAGIVAELNTQLSVYYAEMAQVITGDRFGIRPVGDEGYVALVNGTGRTDLFGTTELMTTGDVRSASVEGNSPSGWHNLDPAIDTVTGLDVLQVLDGYNIGFYAAPFTLQLDLSSVGDYSAAGVSTALIVGRLNPSALASFVPAQTFQPQANRHIQLGTRSIGSARVYFLTPTSFEIDQNSLFAFETEDNGTINFLPDPTLDHQRIPSLPDGAIPTDGQTAASSAVFTSVSQDFLRSGIRSGDKLVLEYHPIAGTKVIPDPVPDLVAKSLTFSVADGPNKVLIFIRDDLSLNDDEVSKQGVVDQINAAAGQTIASLTTLDTLEFSGEVAVTIRKGADSNVHANPHILEDVADTGSAQSFETEDQNNLSPHADTYLINSVTTNTLALNEVLGPPGNFSSPVQNQSFKVLRTGVQRISTTEMAANEAEAALYYFDVELVSEGAGDFWNIGASEQLIPSGYRSDGFYLTTDDENLTFSSIERPKLVLSRSILEEGVEDDPDNATQLTGVSIQITYERSSLVTDIQNFAASETERVVCSSPLSRHLIPHYVRFDLTYSGGSKEDIVVPDLENYITRLSPVEELESSDIQKIVSDRGAISIRNPLDLIAVVHRVDRSVWIQRSQDALSTGRLNAFIADRLNVTRDVTGVT